MFIASAPGLVSKKVLRPKIKPPNQVLLVLIPDTHDTFFLLFNPFSNKFWQMKKNPHGIEKDFDTRFNNVSKK